MGQIESDMVGLRVSKQISRESCKVNRDPSSETCVYRKFGAVLGASAVVGETTNVLRKQEATSNDLAKLR